MSRKIEQQVVETSQLINGVSFPVLRAEEVPEHQFVGAILKGSQRFSVRRAEVDIGSIGVGGEDVLNLQSGGEAREVQDGVQHLRGSAL